MRITSPVREKRRPPEGRRLTERDLLGLDLVAVAQPVVTGHVMRYFGVPRSIAWRILRKLRDFGLVDVHVASMEEENRYTLTVKGAAVLARVRGVEPSSFPVLRGLARVGDHHAAVVEMYVALSFACTRATRHRLVRFAFESELRRRVGGAAGALVPDGVAIIEGGDGCVTAYAVEIDCGTENANYISREKFAPYAELHAVGAPLLDTANWRVLVLAPTLHRLHVLARAAWDAGVPEGLFFFGVMSGMDGRSILREGWVTPRLAEGAKHAHLTTESPFAAARAGCSHGTSGLAGASGRDFNDLRVGASGRFTSGGAR